MSQKSISSSPMDQTRAGSWKESLKAPRIDEAEGKITWMNRGKSREKPGLCIFLPALLLAHLPKLSLGSYPCPQLCASVLPDRWPMAAWEGAVEYPVPTCCSLDKGPEVPHAMAPTDAPLQQPLVSALPVQELGCRMECTDDVRGCLQENSLALASTLQLP